MTFEIEVDGRSRVVSIERAGTAGDGALRLRVSVEGESSLVDVQRSGGFGWSIVFPDAADRSMTVHVAPGPTPGELLAYLGGRIAAVAVNASRTGRGAADAGAGAHGEQKVVAPMPGRVVRILVARGDAVEPRQPIIVVEAMKMENELRSPKAGRVKEITVDSGASVEAGRVLVIID
jgi:biotin carboxyl carrier protein